MHADLGHVSIEGFGFEIPGGPRPLAAVDGINPSRLAALGQEITFASEVDSTRLAIQAARAAILSCEIAPERIALVVTAPTLLTAYALEIPAVALRAELGFENADTLNVAQGCTGFLTGLRLARDYLALNSEKDAAIVVTSCRSSTLTENFTHGGFYWGDGAAAVVLGRASSPSWRVAAYAERSATKGYDAMRIPIGDADNPAPELPLRISVSFPDARMQADYIADEQLHCSAVIDSLLRQTGLVEDDIEAVFFPSFGRNRLSLLLADYPLLLSRVQSDFRYAHMGGVDLPFFFSRYLDRRGKGGSGKVLMLSPAFTAQWAGLLLSLT